MKKKLFYLLLPIIFVCMQGVTSAINWDNDNFINETFWNQNPTDAEIIDALYGSKGDLTAYTKDWSGYNGQCSGINIIKTGILPQYLQQNAIYVLTGDSIEIYLKGYTTMNDCSAIISNHSGGTTISTNNYKTIFLEAINYTIVDSINIDGKYRNADGIVINRRAGGSKSSNHIFHNLNIYNHTNAGIIGYNTKNIIVDKINTYNNGINLYLEKTSNNTIKNLKGNNNGDIVLTNTSNNLFENINCDNNLKLNSGSYNKFYNIKITSGSILSSNQSTHYNEFYNIETNNGLSIGGSYNVIDGLISYNNSVGIGGNHNIINNANIFNSKTVGLLIGGDYISVNNVISHDNGTYGIDIYCGNHVIINNVLLNNNSKGLLSYCVEGYDYNTGLILNNVISINNNSLGIDAHGIYYGTNTIYGNGNNGLSAIIKGETDNLLGLEEGIFIDSGNISWNYMTNPMSQNGEYLLLRGGIKKGKTKNNLFTGIIKYISYGKDIPTQKQAYQYSGQEIIPYGTYNPNNYIGSNVKKIEGESYLSNNKIYINSTDNIITKYSIYGINTPTIGTNIGISSNIFQKNSTIIGQIRGDNYFATHFEVNELESGVIGCDIEYNPIILTSGNVIATLTGCSIPITVINNLNKEYIFTGIGSFTFEYEDVLGNIGETTATVDWIDNIRPTCNIEYTPNMQISGSVLATLTGCSEDIIIINNNGNSGYIFTGNGIFTFEFIDIVGNTGETIANVTRIKKINNGGNGNSSGNGGGGGGGGGGNGGGNINVLFNTGNQNTGTTNTGNSNNGNHGENDRRNGIGFKRPDFSRFNNGNPHNMLENGFSIELNNAYKFASNIGITTMPDIFNADMNGELNRIAMSKMLSQFAINILGLKPDTTKGCSFVDISKELDKEYNNGVMLSCQLGIMGVGIKKFRPYDKVIRAEFATALSRLIFETKDGKDTYYSTHLNKLYKEGIISNTNPFLEETRGYVMLMLMRSVK